MNLPTDKRNLSQYDLFQLLRYGNILPVKGREELENGAEAAEQFTEWMEREKQEQDYQHEINY